MKNDPDSPSAVVPPPSFRRFAQRFPAVVEAYDRFGAELRAAGPLSAREIALVKLAVSAFEPYESHEIVSFLTEFLRDAAKRGDCVLLHWDHR